MGMLTMTDLSKIRVAIIRALQKLMFCRITGSKIPVKIARNKTPSYRDRMSCVITPNSSTLVIDARRPPGSVLHADWALIQSFCVVFSVRHRPLFIVVEPLGQPIGHEHYSETCL